MLPEIKERFGIHERELLRMSNEMNRNSRTMSFVLTVMVVAILVLGLMIVVVAVNPVEESEYEVTPYSRIQSETDELYRIGGEQEVRAYVSRDACLSVHRINNELVLYWWCERFKMIEEAHVISVE